MRPNYYLWNGATRSVSTGLADIAAENINAENINAGNTCINAVLRCWPELGNADHQKVSTYVLGRRLRSPGRSTWRLHLVMILLARRNSCTGIPFAVGLILGFYSDKSINLNSVI